MNDEGQRKAGRSDGKVKEGMGQRRMAGKDVVGRGPQ